MTTYLPIVATTVIAGIVLAIIVGLFMREKEKEDGNKRND